MKRSTASKINQATLDPFDCGSKGSIAFYVPEREVFITGTVNQTANPRLAFQALMRIVNKL